MTRIAAVLERARHLFDEPASGKPRLPGPEAARFLELVGNGVAVADLSEPDMPVCYINRTFEEMTGYRRREVIGRNCRFLQGADSGQPEIAALREAIAARKEITVTLRNYRKDGRLFWNEVRLTPLCDDQGTATHYLGVMRDVTALKEGRDRLEFAATTDRLTGCLNRYALSERLTELGAGGKHLMLINLDVASFNLVNSGYGHDAGDALLAQIAGRLKRVGADAVARIGSNEFAVAFVLDYAVDAAGRLKTVQEMISPRYMLPGGGAAPISATFAIGYVIGGPGDDGNVLIRRAGTALSQSKCTKFLEPRGFDNAAAESAERRLRLTAEIRQGLVNGEFLYHYQPKVDLDTGEIVGAEALLRWQHPEDGLRYPGSFLEIAEETGLLIDIGTSGFRTVASFAARLNEGRREPLTIAVNVTPTMFRQPDIVARAAAVLRDTGVDPRWVTVELTEGLMADSSPELVAVFHQLRELGFGLSIDDFGTGYSSLRYLESFPISEIKIDQSFVRGIVAQPPKRFIVDAVVKIGWALGAAVVAEGVESEDEAMLLRELGCNLAQGYLYGRPIPAEEFAALVR